MNYRPGGNTEDCTCISLIILLYPAKPVPSFPKLAERKHSLLMENYFLLGKPSFTPSIGPIRDKTAELHISQD